MSEPALADASRGPARPETLTVDFHEEPDCVVIHKRSGGGPWLFLLLWLTGWTVGCVMLIGKVLTEPSLGVIVFAVPFWASWLLVASMLVWMLFGKETLFLDRDAAVFRCSAFIRLSSRVVPRQEIQGFRECQSSHTENDEGLCLWGIEMVTLGQPVCFAFRLPDRERAWLIHQLNRFLGTFQPDETEQVEQPREVNSSGTPAAETSCSSETPGAAEVLTLERTLAEPPTDCRWHVTEDFDTFAFRQKGRLNIGALAGLLFVNAFWNGIVSVFVMVLLGLMPNNNPPQGGEWWGLLVFLIPFEVIGLAMFAALVLAVLEPFRRTEWRFERDRIVSQTRWPGYRHTRAWDVLDLDRLELRRRHRNVLQGQRFSDWTADMASELPFELVLVSRNNIDLWAMTGLTEGEARWMAGLILDRCPEWFR